MLSFKFFVVKIMCLLSTQILMAFTTVTVRKKVFENIVEKGKNADIQHFPFLPKMFYTFPI